MKTISADGFCNPIGMLGWQTKVNWLKDSMPEGQSGAKPNSVG